MVKIILRKFIIRMNINELFEKLQEDILGNLTGDLILEGNCIVWSYDLDRDGATQDIEANDDDAEFDFASSTSPAELLQQGYEEDKEAIELFLDGLDEDNWTISDPEIEETQITFKIF